MPHLLSTSRICWGNHHVMQVLRRNFASNSSRRLQDISHHLGGPPQSQYPIRQSRVDGPLDPPLLENTLPDYFSRVILRKYADRPALISRHENVQRRFPFGPAQRSPSEYVHWTFGELDSRVKALANGLLDIGIRKGDRVAVVMGNCSAYALLQWACASIGAILVTINPAYRIHEIIGNLNLVGVKALVTVPQIRTSQYLSSLASTLPNLSSSSPHSIKEPRVPTLRSLIVVDNLPASDQFSDQIAKVKSATHFNDLFIWPSKADQPAPEMATALDQYDVINLQFTSGTTGAPKAVSLTHRNLLNNGYSIGSCMNLTSDDKICNVPPLFHCFGLVLGNLAAWTHGSAIVYSSEIFDPRATLEALSDEQCTGVHGVPTHFLGLLKELAKDKEAGMKGDLSKLRTGIAAGSPIPIELMRKLIDELNLRDLSIAYGMTETSPVSFQTTTNDPLIKRVETVGKVQPHVRAKVVDEHNNVVPVGQPGELCVTGYLVQKGYWNDPEQTAAVYREDADEPGTMWMHTGDTAIMDEEGYLKIVGRIKDIIIRGGENLFPVQIENVVTSHPSISEAAAITVPDTTYGEVVGVWIVRQGGQPSITKEEIKAFVARNMNPQNAPSWVFFVGEDGVEEELPKTASGKVMKNVLREWSRTWAKQGVGLVKTS